MTFDPASATVAAVLTVPLVELALRMRIPDVVGRIVGPSRRSVAVMRARGISDHWKERAMLLYARRTLSGALTLATYLGLLGGTGYVMVVAADAVLPGFFQFLLATSGVVWASLVAFAYLALRRKLAHD